MSTNLLSFLERLQAAALPRPIPGEYRPLAGYLESLGYEPGPIRCVVDWVRRHGTAEGCLWIEQRHEAGVDALLPAGECHAGCEVCRDEESFRRGLLRTSVARRPDDSDLETREAF